GGVLAVGHGRELSVHAFGRQTYETNSPRVTADTLYDAASLSKPVVTTTLLAMLVSAGRIHLDSPLAIYLPEWAAGPNPEWRRKVTVRHLLTHTSGLAPHKPFYQSAKNKRELLGRILAEPLAAEPGTQSAYSDLGFILLGEVVERITGNPLDALARER